MNNQGYEDYYQFIWDVARINDLLQPPMKQCLKEQLGGSEGGGISDDALKARAFKKDKVMNFV